MRRLVLLLICLPILFVSCKKGKADFTLKGTISDLTFGGGFSGLTVNLYEIKAGTSAETLIASTTTGSDGSYSFTFPRDQVESYVIKASPTNYFPIDEKVYFSSLTIEEDNIRDFSTTAKAWLKLRFVNQAPANTTDILRFTKQIGKSDCPECFPDSQQQLNGIVDTTFTCVNDGNTEFKYYYEMVGVSFSGFKSATTIAFDTTTIVLNY